MELAIMAMTNQVGILLNDNEKQVLCQALMKTA